MRIKQHKNRVGIIFHLISSKYKHTILGAIATQKQPRYLILQRRVVEMINCLLIDSVTLKESEFLTGTETRTT